MSLRWRDDRWGLRSIKFLSGRQMPRLRCCVSFDGAGHRSRPFDARECRKLCDRSVPRRDQDGCWCDWPYRSTRAGRANRASRSTGIDGNDRGTRTSGCARTAGCCRSGGTCRAHRCDWRARNRRTCRAGRSYGCHRPCWCNRTRRTGWADRSGTEPSASCDLALVSC